MNSKRVRKIGEPKRRGPKRKRFSVAEDNMILELRETYSLSFEDIADAIDRPKASTVCMRYNKLKRALESLPLAKDGHVTVGEERYIKPLRSTGSEKKCLVVPVEDITAYQYEYITENYPVTLRNIDLGG